ncbi:hypothetical protein KVH15_09765 [Streptomyces olivaceus]|uniref:hypothetical protein n=1 Tax=Streptomyces olivaceus TaxID=47716 RepID=UPI001CCC5A09|nr:hypothetical protein [Streptomyces olivaceus]MBZ6081330.1 hypothetical protein [Streptomyces olivaceus]
MDATTQVARAVQATGDRVLLVQLPGSPADTLIDARANLFSVDFTDKSFSGFVDKVLQPLAPDAALSLSDRGAAAAALVRTRLGLSEAIANRVAVGIQGMLQEER